MKIKTSYETTIAHISKRSFQHSVSNCFLHTYCVCVSGTVVDIEERGMNRTAKIASFPERPF